METSARSETFVPPTARQAVVRSALLNRLCRAAGGTIATIVAPAGYGKTTLLAQWAERDRRPVLWVDLDDLDGAFPLLESRLAASTAEPGLLVLVDDAHLLSARAARAPFERLLELTVAGATVAIAGRRAPRVPLARLRAEGRLLEIGVDDLAFSPRDSATLLRRAGVLLSPPETDLLARRLEGWPVALFLAALSLSRGADAEAVDGDDRFIADYLDTEHLAGLSAAVRDFAVEASVLEELEAVACDSLLGRSDSRQMLESLESAGVVVELDRRRGRYRYPWVVREFLRAELERSEPERSHALHQAVARRAARIGATEVALEHAEASGDPGDVAEFAERLVLSAGGGGNSHALDRSLEVLHDDAAIESHPDLCVAASWLHALRGSAAEAQHWADASMRGLSGEDSRLHVLRALRCRDGADQMLDDANAACAGLPAGHPWRAAAVLARGAALVLAGDAARAKRELVEAVELAEAVHANDLRLVGLCLLAELAIGDNAREDAEAFVAEADAVAAGDTSTASLVGLMLEAVRARNAARGDDLVAAAGALDRAEELLPFATPAVPWLSVAALLELVHVRLALADADEARALLRRIADILRVRPRLGTLVQRTAELDARTHQLAEPQGRWASSLTPAERRLLPLLATHLSFREIGDRLYVSRNTVKTQAIAVYRKLGVTSRSGAIERAVALGLLDDNAVHTREAFPCAG